MAESDWKVYPYRWVVLAAFMFVVAVTQLLWITFAPITIDATKFYQVSDLKIGILSMVFMIVYVFVAIPASWVIDTYGFRIAVGIGAAITALFGLLRGVFSRDYTLVLLMQTGVAVGQPFVLGSITKVAARWFPPRERATASGLGSLAMYVGIIAGMALTPPLALRWGMGGMLMIHGIVSVASAIIFLLAARERPPTPPCPPGLDERVLVFDGLKHMFRQRDFLLLLSIFFICLGIFNGISTWIEDIVRPRGFTIAQAGNLGGLMVVGGIVGSVLMPPLSDRLRKRKPFLLLALVGAIPGFVGMSFSTSYGLVLLSGFTFGFFLLSAAPIGFQYAVEVTSPAPEGTSNGLLIQVGQISGIAAIFGMDFFKSPETGSMTSALLVSVGLLVLSCVLCAGLREPAVRT